MLGPVWDIGLLILSVLGTGLAYWRLSYRIGKRDGAHSTALRNLAADVKKLEEANEKSGNHQANQFLRIFQAVEQLRRLHKTGNGGVEWVDLVGKD